jgi:hypothetical protein
VLNGGGVQRHVVRDTEAEGDAEHQRGLRRHLISVCWNMP